MADERRILEQLLAALDGSFGSLLGPFARNLATLVRRAPKDASGTLSPAGRMGIARWLDGALTALFGTSPSDAEASTFGQLVAAASTDAALASATPLVADATARLAARPDLMAALRLGASGGQQPRADSTRTWVDPNGHRLSDRIWLAGQDIRSRIDGLLDYEIGRGTTATDLATRLEHFLTPQGAAARTRTPYGRDGSYAARRLARTETTRAYGLATVEAASSNPFVTGIRWRLSAAHPESDVCDELSAADRHGLGPGIYRPGQVPTYPPHPQCLCALVPVVVADTASVAARLGAWAREGGDRLPLDAAAIAEAVSGFPQAAD